jgi:Response regulator containing a CheY-like receiver domain and an HTH DNA-binding domain
MQEAKQTIYSQEDMPLSVKRSAWALFQHELGRINPATQKPFTARKALANVLKWMALQRVRQREGLKYLPPMHRKILQLMVNDGLTQKQIALRLGKAERTVKRYCIEIRELVQVDSIYQAIAVAVELGWISAPKTDD